jgi:ABC-type Fe3+ transport system permease subunit
VCSPHPRPAAPCCVAPSASAARIDGASEFGISRTMVLPLLRPSLGALAVRQFLQSYNSFLWPLVLVSDSSQYTLPLGLQTLFVSEQRQYDLVLAGAVIAVVPAVALSVVLRKQLLEGLSTGAVKGCPVNNRIGEGCSSFRPAFCSAPPTTTSTSRTNG